MNFVTVEPRSKGKNQIIIRNAEISDAKSIAYTSTTALGYPCDSELVSKKLESIDDARERVYVAVIDDKVVGFIQLEIYRLLYQRETVNVLGLAVNVEAQGQGAGRKLMEAAEAWAMELGLDKVRLNSAMGRTKAHLFYEHLGYVNTKEQKRFIKRLSD